MVNSPIVLARPQVASFASLSLCASFLLFLVQPLIAKMAMPQLGGNPAVWTSAMLAFQALLLVGYAYAHWLLGRAPRLQIAIHFALLVVALLWLPLGFNASGPPEGNALVYWVPWRVIVAVGPLFVLLAAQAPLLQGWYRDSKGEEPYALYRFSNIGSFLGLLAYPLIIEPLTALTTQRVIWSGGFALFGIALTVLMAMKLRYPTALEMPERVAVQHDWPDWRTALKWTGLAAVPSGLILSTTAHVTTDIIAMPLLWVLPLALYLLSFVVAFSDTAPMAERIAKHTAPLIAILGLIALSTEAFEIYITGPASMALLFVASLALHRSLYLSRPASTGLTSFYLLLALGGVLGGFAVAVLAPLLFDWTYEFPLLILAAIGLNQIVKVSVQRYAVLTAIGLAMAFTAAVALQWINLEPIWYAGLAAVAVLLIHRSRFAVASITLCGSLCISGIDYLYLGANGRLQRSYFGTYLISENDAGTLRRITHGTTSHGAQSLVPNQQKVPISYFGHQSGVGRALNAVPRVYGPGARIGVVGIGAGTLACYAQQGQHWTFYEIDPLVVDIAVRQSWFNYMKECAPDARIVLGDARLTLAKQDAQSLDVLVIDAFTSDAVPTHLITRQAFDIYDRVLAQNGTLLIHISNRYLDLAPVLASEAAARGWHAASRMNVPSAEQIEQGESASKWIILARSPAQMEKLIGAVPDLKQTETAEWEMLNPVSTFTRWSDEYNSVLSLIKWRKTAR